MKIRKSLLILTEVIALGAFTGIAHANEDLQVWRDSDGVVVRNSWDNCVRSRWDVNGDACAEPVAYQPPPRTMISEEERTVYFGFNKATLTDDDKARLDSLASRLNSADDVTGARIVGYADRIGTASYNQQLSKKRADNVRAYLVSRGFVKESKAETRWVGKSQPTANCPGKESHDQLVSCLQPDRKVTVELIYATRTSSMPRQNVNPVYYNPNQQ